MRKIGLLIVICLLLIFSGVAQSLGLKVYNGDFQNVTQLNLVFVYDGVTYDGDNEGTFFKNQENDVDHFEEWKIKWTGEFRTELWEKQFLLAVAEKLYDRELDICYCNDAKYSMVIYMNDIDPGSYTGPYFWSNPAKLDGSMIIVHTPENIYDITEDDWIFYPITFDDFCGKIANQETDRIMEHRVQASFGELGTMIGDALRKVSKKKSQKY